MNIFFDGWDGVFEVLITIPFLYIAMIIFIRLTGKRSTSQMNNFDWLVTVAMGSLVGSGIILSDVTLLETLASISGLLICQYITTRLVMSNNKVKALVKAEPRLLVSEGDFLREAMRAERVTEDEIMAALRENAVWRVEDAQWVILETNAILSVIPRTDGICADKATTLAGVNGMPKIQ